MLGRNSEDIYGMEIDVGYEQSQNPPHTGRWAATSTYDIKKVDTSKDDGEDGGRDLLKDINADKPSKRRHQRRRSRARRDK